MAHGATMSAEDLFGGRKLSDADLSLKFDTFLKAVSSMPEKELSKEEFAMFRGGGGVDFAPRARTPYDSITKALAADVEKGLSPDAVASITGALEQLKAQQPDLTKDFNLTSPIPSGAVAFDLQAPMRETAPRPTPLRNRIPRTRGFGTSARFKTITGFTGSGSGGVGVIHPGISDSTQTNFAPSGASNALYYARGPKISYAGSDTNLPYMQNSLSDEVTWSAQFAGQGYQDIRQVSRVHLLWASMLMEERLFLYSRGTNSAYSGVLSAPTIGTGTARSAAAGEAAITGFTTNIYVKIVAELGDFGVSQTSAAATAAVSAGQVVDVTYTLPAGATGARAFVSTGASDPGDASRWLVTGYLGARSGYNTLTVQGALPTSGNSVAAYTTPNGTTVNVASTDGGTGFTNGYDGMWAYLTGPNSGYNTALNAAFSTTSPGAEYQAAFASMFDAVKADPDHIMLNGRDRKQLSEALKTSTGGPYSLRLTQDDISGVTAGAIVTSIINEITGKNVDVEVHPWMPQGNSMIISDTLPIPDSQISNVWEARNVQDYLGMDWPVNQFAYESSSYWYGTLVNYAPPFNGAVRGIKLA